MVNCIGINEGAEVDLKDAYMMIVLAGDVAAKFTTITTAIWTDCLPMLKATENSWKTTTWYADQALAFENI